MQNLETYTFNIWKEAKNFKKEFRHALKHIRTSEDYSASEDWGSHRYNKVEFVEVSKNKAGKTKTKFEHFGTVFRAVMDFSMHSSSSTDDYYDVKEVAEKYESALFDGSYNRFVMLHKNTAATNIFEGSHKEAARAFTLDHETGHILLRKGTKGGLDNDNPYKECACDAFAAIRSFQRFGAAAAPFLSLWSWFRADVMVEANTSHHMTTTVLDKIIQDSKNVDFSKRTPEETLRRAEEYGRQLTPSKQTLAITRDLYSPHQKMIHTGLIGTGIEEKLKLLAQTCLSTQNDFAFYTGARFFQPFLQPQGIILDGKLVQLEEKTRVHYQTEISTRAEKADYSAIFDAEAGKDAVPVKDMLSNADTQKVLKLNTPALPEHCYFRK